MKTSLKRTKHNGNEPLSNIPVGLVRSPLQLRWKNTMSDLEKSLDPIQETIDYTRKKGRLELMSGLLGINNLQQTTQQNLKNQEAENAFVRKNAWNSEEQSEGNEDMGQTVLGDLQTTTYVTNQPSSIGKALLGMGLLAMGIGGPTGAYFIADAIKNRPATVINQSEITETVEDTDSVIEWNLE